MSVRRSGAGRYGTYADAGVQDRGSHVDKPVVERRQDMRRGQPEIAGTQAILRPGYAVALIDVSCRGALIQGPRPLRPGAGVHIQLHTGTRRLGLTARVLRCSVASLDPRQGVQYRGAIQFDHRCDVLWEDSALGGDFVPGEVPTNSIVWGQDIPNDPTLSRPHNE